MDYKQAAVFCEQGHAADDANRRGEHPTAREGYLGILRELDAEADSLQAYLAAKAALGLLLNEVRAGQLQRGQELGDRQHELAAARHGIGLLERGYATAPDNALYLMLSAYLTSIGADDKELASREVCALMARATRSLDPLLRPRAALNWRCHLEQIHQGPAPGRWLKQIDPPPAEGGTVAFVNPDAWYVRGLPRRIDPRGDFPLRPPRIEAPPAVSAQSPLWPWLWLFLGVVVVPIYSGQPSVLWMLIGLVTGCVFSVPGWLLDYGLRRGQWVGVAVGIVLTLLTPAVVRMPAWAYLPALLWWTSAGAGIEIAIRHVRDVLDRSPRLESILDLMGAEKWAEAKAQLDRALAKHPKNWRMLGNRAVCHAVLDQAEEAEADFEEATQVLGGSRRLESVHGYLLWRYARDGSQDALQRAVRELQAGDIDGYRMRVACHVLDENWEAAHTVLEEGLKRYPGSSALKLDRARMHLAHGRADAAAADLLEVVETSNQEGAVREARAALLAIGAEPEDPALTQPPDPEVYVSPDGHFSVWFPARPRALAAGLYLQHGGVHYLLEPAQGHEDALRVPELARLRGVLSWESRLSPTGDVLSPEVLMDPLEFGMRQYSRVTTAGGDEMLSRRAVIPNGYAQAGKVYLLSIWGPQGALENAFQFLGSFAPAALGRRPAYLFANSQPLPGRPVPAGLEGSSPWLTPWKGEAALTLEERPCVLEVDSLERLRASGDAAYAPYHKFVAYQHLGPMEQGTRGYEPLRGENVPELAAALQESAAESLLLLAAGFQPGTIRALADRLDGLTFRTLGFLWCFSGENLTDDASVAEEIAYAARTLHCRRLSILTSSLDGACRKLLADGFSNCPELELYRVFARDEERTYPAFELQ